MRKQVASDLATKSKTAADTDGHASATAVGADGGSTPVRAATVAAVTAVAPSVPVPTTRSLRMLLGVLKHNPAGTVQEVGVLLMLYVSFVEMAKKKTEDAAATAAETPAALPSNKGGGKGVKAGKRSPPRTKQREECAQIKRRSEEAATVLALALAAEKQQQQQQKKNGSVAAAGVAVPAHSGSAAKKGSTTRFRHQLRQPAKIEDRLQPWAATRGREVAGVRRLLALSTRGGLAASSAGARLVRDRAERISARKATKVRCSSISTIRQGRV